MLSSAVPRRTAATLAALLACAVLTDAAAQAPPPYPYPPQQYPPQQYPPQPYPPYPYPQPYGYPPPYPAAPPPPAAPPQPQPPGVVYDWDPDAPPPDGYTMVETLNSRVLTTGIALLGSAWLLSVFAASIGSTGERQGGAADGDGVDSADWTPLYVPVAGPFFAIGTLDPSPSGVGLLLADGVMQLGGAVGIVVGVIDRKYKLVRHAGLSVTPSSTASFRGLSVSGRF